MSAPLHLDPLAAHDLRLGTRRVLFHVPTNALFDLGPIAAEVLDLFRTRSCASARDVRMRFEGEFAPAALAETIAELGALGVLVDARAETREPDRIRVAGHPLETLVLNVTTGCNLSCTYCYKEDLSVPASARRMSREVALRSIDLLLREGAAHPRLGLVFFGGEPLTRFDLIRDAVAYAERRASEAGKAFDFSITTNATLLDERIVDYLDRHRFSIAVSIDGPRAVHDRHRRTVGAKGTYEVVERKVRMLLDRYTSRPVGARVTLTRGATDVVAIHRHLVGELGFDEAGFAPATSAPVSPLALGPEDLEAVFSGLRALGERYVEAAVAGHDIGFTNLDKLVRNLHVGNTRSVPCGAGIGLLAVDASGGLNLCHRFTGSSHPTYGDVALGIDRPRLAAFVERAADRTDTACERCHIRNLCAGGCYHESHARLGDPLAPVAHYCDLMRAWVDHGIEAYLRIMDANPDYLAGGPPTRRQPR